MRLKGGIPAIKQNPEGTRDKTLENILKAKSIEMRTGTDMEFSMDDLVSIPGDQRTKVSWRSASGSQQEIIAESRASLAFSLSKVARDATALHKKHRSLLFKAWILPHIDPKERFSATSVETATIVKDSQHMAWPILIAPWGRHTFYVVRDQAAFEEKVLEALSEASHEKRVHVIPVTEPTYAPRASVGRSLEEQLKSPSDYRKT